MPLLISLQLHTDLLSEAEKPALLELQKHLEKYELVDSQADYLTFVFATSDMVMAWLSLEILLDRSNLKKIALVICQSHEDTWDDFICLHSFDKVEYFSLLKAHLNYLADTGFKKLHEGIQFLLKLKTQKQDIKDCISQLCIEHKDDEEKNEILLSISDALYGAGPIHCRFA